MSIQQQILEVQQALLEAQRREVVGSGSALLFMKEVSEYIVKLEAIIKGLKDEG